MLVKYIGVPDQMTCDYNGKRYVFLKSTPISNIPMEVFRTVIRESNGILSEQVIPLEAPSIPNVNPNLTEERPLFIPKEDNLEYSKKKRGRPRNVTRE